MQIKFTKLFYPNACRIENFWWVFALAGGLAMVIALVTVSAQATKAALANPIESLRHE